MERAFKWIRQKLSASTSNKPAKEPEKIPNPDPNLSSLPKSGLITSKPKERQVRTYRPPRRMAPPPPIFLSKPQAVDYAQSVTTPLETKSQTNSIPIIAERAINYLGKISDKDLADAYEWTKDKLEDKSRFIPRNVDTVTFNIIPENIAQILVRITELHAGRSRDPRDVLDDYTNLELWGTSQKVLKSYFEPYPQIQNLGQLLGTFKRKFQADTEKS